MEEKISAKRIEEIHRTIIKINEVFNDQKRKIIETSAFISDYGCEDKIYYRPIEETKKLLDKIDEIRIQYLEKAIPEYKILFTPNK